MQYEHIATTELTSPAASISFQNIDTIYRFFRLTCWYETTTNTLIPLTLNNDTGNNYIWQYLLASSTTVSGARSAAGANIDTTATAADSGQPGFVEVLIGKSVAGEEARTTSMSVVTTTNENLSVIGAEWNNTADLINRIDLATESGNFIAGSRAILEGARVENA